MRFLLTICVCTLFLTSGICDITVATTDASTTASTSEDTTSTTVTDTTPVETTSSTTVPTSLPTTAPPTTQPTTPVPTSPPTTIPPTTIPTTTPTTPKTTTPVIPTTTEPITTTPEPPKPDLGEWNVTDDNITCIRADLRIRFKIPVKDKFEYIVLSPNATSSGSSCNATNGTQVLQIVDSDYTFSMTFDKDGNTKTYVKEIKLAYRLPPNIVGNVVSDTPQFSVQSGSSYLCNTGNVALENVTMEIMHIQLQSFGSKANLEFGATEECEGDNQVDDMVPIVVGCALLALVVIVLVAYFVGRRRSRQKGYQSV